MYGRPLIPNQMHLRVAAALLIGGTAAGPAAAGDAVPVVASIRPVHSLVSAVMAGVGEPHLVMRSAASHHGFDMRPSDAAVLQEARIVFLIDKSMESGLAAAIDTLTPDARVVELSGAHGLIRRALRAGGEFEADPIHATHDHGHDDDPSDDHARAEDGPSDDHARAEDDHDDEHARGEDDHDDDHAHGEDDHDDDHAHGEDDHDGPQDGRFDLHIWLDPVNAAAMTHMIADTLSGADPANAARYEDNAHHLIHRLEDLTAEVTTVVAPVRDRPFIVFHDGYRYFEDRFGLAAAGSAVVSPERSPGVRRIRELRAKVSELGVVCVIDEPQFDRRFVDTVIEGSDVRAGTVDPMGAAIEDGPELYFTLIRAMAAVFRDCLAPAG